MRNKRLLVVRWRVVDFGVNHLDNLVIVSKAQLFSLAKVFHYT